MLIKNLSSSHSIHRILENISEGFKNSNQLKSTVFNLSHYRMTQKNRKSTSKDADTTLATEVSLDEVFSEDIHEEPHHDLEPSLEILDQLENSDDFADSLLIPIDLLDEDELFDDFDEEEMADFEDFDGEEDGSEEDDQFGSIGGGSKKERSLARIPIERSNDRRHVGKGMQKFLDIEIPQEYLEGLPPELIELFKK